MRKLINWCKSNWLIVVSCFLLAFIPLYPKLPLFDIVQTWVYIRIEDFLVAFTFLAFAVYLFKTRQKPDTPLTVPIIVYWVVGGVATLIALFALRYTPEALIPHLAALHFGRRIEYMGLFFIGFYALKNKPKALPWVIWTLSITLLGIIIYGVGQKFLGWPAYLTMNEEFSKGVPLRLPPTARIPSTFGGHYDLAAYLVFIIPLFGSLAFDVKRIWQKAAMALLAVGGLVLLLFTASRVSFGVYLIAVTLMLVWKRKYWYILPVIVVSFLLLNSVSTASERFYKTLRFSDVVIDLSTGQPIGTLDEVENGKAIVNKKESPATESLPKGSEYLSAPAVSTPTTPAKTLKSIEVYTSSPLATGAGEIATVSGSFLVQKAFVYDISITTRFQAEWPNAMAAFKRNLLFGSGFSSLSVAVDGDYMRMLGETGIAGTVAFLGIFLVAFWIYFRNRGKVGSLEGSFVTGLFAGLVGLFLNGVLIDVFEASKVAFTLWLLMGVALALLWVHPIRFSYFKMLWKALTSSVAYYVYIVIAAFVLYQRSLTFYFIGDDFTWLRWAASTTIKDLPKYFTDASGFFYRPIPKLFYFVLYTVFWLKPGAYHIVSVCLLAILSGLLFLLQRRLNVKPTIALLVTFVFLSLSIHHENVIWISGMSSLLSAIFLCFGLILVTYWKKRTGWKRVLTWIMILVFTLLALGSWEAALVGPFMILVLAWTESTVSFWEILTILLTDVLYWWARTHAHAVGAAGDYGIRASTIFVNGVGNTVGYITSIFAGPKALEYVNNLRASLRGHIGFVSVIGAVGLGILGAVSYASRRLLQRIGKTGLIWIVLAVVSLIPFVGLGNMSERYALVASVCFAVFIGLLIDRVFRESSVVSRIVVFIICIGIFSWNTVELNRVTGDWETASHIVESTVLTLKTNYFPLRDKQAFVFVNTPIRYGRAWVFPTGLNDALWHMFKFNPYPYRVYVAGNVKDAFKITSPVGVPVVLVFDQKGNLNKAIKIVKTVEEK